MSAEPIITPTLVRRYLRAASWTLGTDGWWTGTNERGEAGCGFPDTWVERAPLDADVLARVAGNPIGALRLVARLGMLAAAEMYRDTLASASTTANERAFYVQAIESAGVDPEAWEKARS